jgi:hypothetical protein
MQTIGISTVIGAGILFFLVWAYMHKPIVDSRLFADAFLYSNTPTDEFRTVPRSSFDWGMVATGRDFAKSEGKLLVTSLVRDCEKSIPCMEKKIGVLAEIFREVHVVFFENNSKDDTRKRLLEYTRGKSMGGQNVKVTVINPFTMEENEEMCVSNSDIFTNNHKCEKINGASTGRIGRMARLRNMMLDYIYRHQDKYTTLLITDMDILGRWFPTGICETVGYLRTLKKVGFITFRGYFPSGGHFDPFSFKAIQLPQKARVATLLLCMLGYFVVPVGRGLWPVASSHSGGVFANLPLKPDLSYEVENVLSLPVGISINLCEHVSFMEKMGGNFVNTNMTYLVKDNV